MNLEPTSSRLKNNKIMLSFFKKNSWLIFGLLVLMVVVLVNLFPRGYVFGGGDTIQLIENGGNLKNIVYDWEGRALFFNAFFRFLNLIGLSNSTQLSFHLGIFIFSSYLLFYLFSNLIFLKTEQNKKVLVALFYALNLYTLFLFTGNWGYSYFPSLYIVLPLIVGLFIKFIETKKNIFGVFFVFVFFFGSSGFANPAFLLSFIIFIFVLIVALIVFKYIKFNKILALKIFLLAVFSFLASSAWLLPLISELKGGVAGLQSSDVVEFNWWIRQTASPIAKTLSLNHFSEDYFPYNFYYKDLTFLKNLFLLLSFLPIIAITIGLFLKRTILPENRRFFWIFIFILMVFTLLVARLTAPFDVVNYYIYHLPGFITLRGFDKTAIYIPFLLSVLLLISISNIKSKKVFWTIFALILITPLPFFAGKIQQTAGYRVSSKKDYKEAPMSFLIKIPDEYYNIRDLINSDKKISFIATLPETYNDGSGITYYPKWNFYGADITKYIFNKKFIDANGFYFKEWSPASEFNKNTKNPSWLPKLFGMMNSKYIIYHKDAPEDSVLQSQYKMQVLESESLIKILSDNDYFTLYEISPDLVLSYIIYQRENMEWRNDPVWIGRNFDKIKNNTASTDFREINPKKFEVNFDNSKFSRSIVLAEKYDPLWKAYAVDKNGKETELKNHFLARGYANGWNIENPEDVDKILIEYYPIRLMWRGIWISGATVLFLLIYLIRYSYNKFRKNKLKSVI